MTGIAAAITGAASLASGLVGSQGDAPVLSIIRICLGLTLIGLSIPAFSGQAWALRSLRTITTFLLAVLALLVTFALLQVVAVPTTEIASLSISFCLYLWVVRSASLELVRQGFPAGFVDYFWRLVPANPILLRVVDSGGKRRRDLFIRCGYLGLLVFFVVFASIGNSGTSLNELSKTSGWIFQQMSYLQLALVALLAPIFTAGAITQEKDSQTYDILLCTPLSNGQIVLGSLLSRLFFVVTLLISGIPIFSITQIFGGVAISSIVMSFAIAAATAFVTGALAMAIATFKVGTGRTIFSFYLFIVMFLVGGAMLDRISYFKIDTIDPVTKLVEPSQTSWLTPINPFLALTTVIGGNYTPPALGSLPEHLRGWPVAWMLTSPASFYVSLMFTISLVMVLPSIVLLRRMAQSTVSLKSYVLQKLRISSGDRNRKPRVVWMNPIAWREAKTKASAARATVLRYSFILIGIIGAIALAVMYWRVEPIGVGYTRYVAADSFNAETRTFTVYRADDSTTYRVNGQTKLTYNGVEIEPEDLHSRLRVIDDPSIGPNKTIRNISLGDIPRHVPEETTRSLLLGAVMVEFAVILLIVTNAAASTVTREKEDGTLDLLLTTPITSHRYIWGKLRGLVSFVVPLIAVPVSSVAVFVAFDLFHTFTSPHEPFRWIAFWESLLLMPALLIVVSAFAAIVGMQMSLRCRTTVMAVMASVGIVCGACGALGWCGYASLDMSSPSTGNLVISGFSPFTVLTMLIDPYHFGGRLIDNTTTAADISGYRWWLFVSSWASIGAYTAIVWTMYKSMVKNFDMTIRRQSR